MLLMSPYRIVCVVDAIMWSSLRCRKAYVETMTLLPHTNDYRAFTIDSRAKARTNCRGTSGAEKRPMLIYSRLLASRFCTVMRVGRVSAHDDSCARFSYTYPRGELCYIVVQGGA